MFEPLGGPQTGNQYTAPSMNQQGNSLVGSPQIQTAALPQFDPGVLNSTAIQASGSPAVANIVKALKGP